MKKILLTIFYMIFFAVFNGLLIFSYFCGIFNFNIKIINEDFTSWIAENSFLIFIIINLLVSFFVSRIKISKKILIITPIVITAIKAILVIYFTNLIFSEPSLDDIGQGGVFVLLFLAPFYLMLFLDVVFFIGVVIGILTRREDEDKKVDN